MIGKVTLALGALLASGSARCAPDSASCTAPPSIHFAPGTTSGRVSGVLARGGVACYAIYARAGQTLSATVSSPDQNVVFQIYQPGARATPEKHPDMDDGYAITGKTLPGAGETDDAQQLRTQLPDTGRYLIDIGLLRGGGGAFTFDVSVTS